MKINKIDFFVYNSKNLTQFLIKTLYIKNIITYILLMMTVGISPMMMIDVEEGRGAQKT